MTEEHNFEITKNNETRITEALESIAGSLQEIKTHIISDPGDEVEHIKIKFPKDDPFYKHLPDDYKMD